MQLNNLQRAIADIMSDVSALDAPVLSTDQRRALKAACLRKLRTIFMDAETANDITSRGATGTAMQLHRLAEQADGPVADELHRLARQMDQLCAAIVALEINQHRVNAA